MLISFVCIADLNLDICVKRSYRDLLHKKVSQNMQGGREAKSERHVWMMLRCCRTSRRMSSVVVESEQTLKLGTAMHALACDLYHTAATTSLLVDSPVIDVCSNLGTVPPLFSLLSQNLHSNNRKHPTYWVTTITWLCYGKVKVMEMNLISGQRFISEYML